VFIREAINVTETAPINESVL